jgi:hypothetical protein
MLTRKTKHSRTDATEIFKDSHNFNYEDGSNLNEVWFLLSSPNHSSYADGPLPIRQPHSSPHPRPSTNFRVTLILKMATVMFAAAAEQFQYDATKTQSPSYTQKESKLCFFKRSFMSACNILTELIFRYS